MIKQGRDIPLSLPGYLPLVVDKLQIFAERLVKLLQNQDLVAPLLPAFVPGGGSQCDSNAYHNEDDLAERIAPIWS